VLVKLVGTLRRSNTLERLREERYSFLRQSYFKLLEKGFLNRHSNKERENNVSSLFFLSDPVAYCFLNGLDTLYRFIYQYIH
jgi:hypothetical protein